MNNLTELINSNIPLHSRDIRVTVKSRVTYCKIKPIRKKYLKCYYAFKMHHLS